MNQENQIGIKMIILLSSLIALGSCFHPFTTNAESVIDGDTIKNVVIEMDFGIKITKTIRIIGIDAPEMRGVPDSEKKRAVESRDRLRAIIGSCSSLRLVPHGTDSFGRTLAKVFCGNQNIAETLIKEGFAKQYK